MKKSKKIDVEGRIIVAGIILGFAMAAAGFILAIIYYLF